MEKELDLLEIWQVIVKRWKLVILIPLLAALSSAIVSIYIITPLYSASTTLMITRQADATQILYSDIQISRQLVQTYREIVRSYRVLEMVIANRALPYSVGELRDKVEVQAVRDTELIIIEVTDPDPVMASGIANEVALSFMDQIVEIMNVENISIIDAAITPDRAVSPRVPLNTAVTFVVGLMAAIGFVFLLEYQDRTIKDPSEAQRLLGITVIGVIPEVANKQLFASSNPRAPASEAMRTMRTNIQFAGIDKELKRILVTGANPACGKSTVTANLGVTLAQTGAKVLLVDADLRKPTMHQIFEINKEPGLTNLIINPEMTTEKVIQKSGYNNLYILSSGPVPPYPAELLNSAKMKALVELIAKEYDYLVFNSPPVIAVTDSAILSTLTDGTLFVLDYGRVTRDEAAWALEQLGKVQAKIIGTVLNAVPYSKSYYNGYQYYYGSDSEDKKVDVPPL